MRRSILFATATLAGVALCSAAAPAQSIAKPGKKPEFAFAEPLANGVGVTSLESMKGRPVLFEFWGTY